MKTRHEFEGTAERELLVSNEELAEQLAKTNISAAAFVEQLKDPSLAMYIMRVVAGQTLRFPASATILKSAIVVFIRKELAGTYKGEKKRRAIVKRVQQELEERGIKCTRNQIQRIYKAKRWVI